MLREHKRYALRQPRLCRLGPSTETVCAAYAPAPCAHIRIFVYSVVSVKPIQWLGSSLRDLRDFPSDAKQVAGFQLYRVQCDLEPNDWKPMPSVGPGVREIRIGTDLQHRVLYTTTMADTIYVLHAFEKKTQKTPKRDFDIARDRLRKVVDRKRKGYGTKD